MLEGRRLDTIDSTRAIFKFIINLNERLCLILVQQNKA